MRCVCVPLCLRPRIERERGRETLMRWLHGNMSYKHESPRDNKEVAMEVNPLPFWCSWAENGEGKRKGLGLVCLSPFYGNVR